MKLTHRSPSLASWPLQIYNIEEVKDLYKNYLSSITKDQSDLYKIIYFPLYDSVLCYGNGTVSYMYDNTCINILVEDIVEIETSKELLEASMIIKTHEHTIEIHYVTSTYYLFNPFLDYLCQLPESFSLYKEEKKNPRPKSLYAESLCMYNYCLEAYRLGSCIMNYDYRYRNKREKWMPWKIHKEEKLSVNNERGIFNCYSYKYIIKCKYIIKR